ncbi:MAG: EexN family lipoprotein [Woeseiaceae bacterium]
MSKTITLTLLGGALFFSGCSQEQPARTVQEFLDSPQFLEAAVVRCSQNRAETRYDTECVNARQAVSLIEAREERARRERLEQQSESKRDALRRTQRAASEARRRAAEQEQLRKEAEYLAQFGEVPPTEANTGQTELEANVPGAVIQSHDQAQQRTTESTFEETPPVIFDEPVREETDSLPASDGGNAPVIENSEATDLDAVRDELRRRQDENSN